MDIHRYNRILDDLLIDRESSSKKFKNIEEAKNTTPVYGIAKVNKDFDWFFQEGKIKKFKKDEQYIMLASLYMSLEYDSSTGDKILSVTGKHIKNYYKEYNGQDLTNKTLFVWRSGGIGDILFIQPSLRYLKVKYPSCKILFGCSPTYFPLLETWGDLIDELVSVPFTLNKLISADYHMTYEGIIERCEEAEKENAYVLFSKKMGLDIPRSILRPVLKTKKESNDNVLSFLNKNKLEKGNYICFQLRASSAIRTPPLDLWARILIPLLQEGHKIVVTDMPKYEKYIMELLQKFISNNLFKNIYSFCKYSKTISDSISLAKYSKLVLAPDSSMAHIGAGVMIPTMGIYAPFDGKLRMETYENSDWIQPETDDINICKYGGRCCFLHGHEPCPYNVNSASPCFYRINIEKALTKINSLLEK